MKNQNGNHFKLYRLLDPAYVYAQLRAIQGPSDLWWRIRDLFVLAGKIATLRYGEKYWERQRTERLHAYSTNQDIAYKANEHVEMGRILFLKKNFNGAILAFSRALAQDPHYFSAYAELAKTYQAANRYDEAFTILQRALIIAPEDPQLLLLLGKMHKEKKNFDEAFRIFETIRMANKTSKTIEAEVHFEEAQMHYMREDYDQAIEALQNALALGYRSSDCYSLLAKTFAKHKRYKESLSAFATANKLGSDDKKTQADIHRKKAQIYFQENKYDCALKEVAKAVLLGIDSISDSLLLSKIFIKKRTLDKAWESIERALKSDEASNSQKAELHHEKGTIYYTLKQYNAAVLELQKAIQYDPAFKAPHVLLATIYQEMGEYGHVLDRLAALEYQSSELKVEEKDTLRQVTERLKTVVLDTLPLSEINAALDTAAVQKDLVLHNKLLSLQEMLTHKTQLQSKPQSMKVVLTNHCNLACIMCDNKQQTGWDISEPLVQLIEGYIPYLTDLDWQGGEVFLSKHFERLVKKGTQNTCLKQNVITNGLLINDYWAELLVGSGVNIMFSIDGTDKKTYESIRKKGNYETLVKNLALIQQYRNNSKKQFRIGMNYVLFQPNFHDIRNIYAFAEKYGMNYVCINTLENIGSKESFYAYYTPAIIDNIEKECAVLQEKCAAIQIGVTCNIPRHKPLAKNEPIQSDTGPRTAKMFCTKPWKSMFFENTLFRPECVCAKSFNVDGGTRLESLWNNEYMQEYRATLLRGDLASCAYKCTERIYT